jgi:hypothetical protein
MNGLEIGLYLQNKESKMQIDKVQTQANNMQYALSSEVCYTFFAKNV